MIEGLFDVAVDTPKYHRRGTMNLHSAGDIITVELNITDLDPLVFEGTCQGKDFSLEGSGDLPGLGQVDYQATGNVWGNSVTVGCTTSAGKVDIFGTRLSMAAGGVKSSHDYMMAASNADFSTDDGTMYSGLYADGG